MEPKKRRWLRGCVLAGVLLGLPAMGGLVWLVWHREAERRKPCPVVVVVTYYPCMSAPSIEKTITNRIERWVNQASGSTHITSRSLTGVSIVRVSFRNDVDPNLALTQVNELALGTLPTLPPDTLPPVVLPVDPESAGPMGVLTVTGTAATEVAILEAADGPVRERARIIPGVVAPVVLGGKERILVAHEVQDQFAAPAVCFRVDGRSAVGVPVYLQQGMKRQDVYEKLTSALPSLEDQMPPGVGVRWVPLRASRRWLRPQDDGLLTIYLRAPSNSRLAQTEKRVAAVEDLLQKSIPANEREAILSEVGMSPDGSVLYTANSGPMDATIFVQLSGDRTLSAAEYAARLRQGLNDDPQFADLRFRFASRDMPAPVDVRISAEKAVEAVRLAREIRRRLAAVAGAVGVQVVQRADAPRLLIAADRRKARDIGLSAPDVLAQALTALHVPASAMPQVGIEAGDGGRAAIDIPLPLDPDVNLDDISQTTVAGTKLDQPIRLSSLIAIERTSAPVEIDHVNLVRVFDARANVEGRDRRDVLADIRKMLQELQVPEGVKVELAE